MIVHELDIEAPPHVVYELFTDPGLFAQWMAATAELDPRAGGAMRWTHDNGRTVAGRFIELVPSRRLVFAYGWEDGWLGVAAGSTRVVVELSPAAGGSGTRLRLTHHGLEGEAADQHQRGWAHFLARLSANAARRAVTNPSSNPSSRTVTNPSSRTVTNPSSRTSSNPSSRTVTNPSSRTVTNPSSRTSIVEPDQSSGTPPPAGEERSSA